MKVDADNKELEVLSLLKVPEWVAPCIQYVPLYIHPESNEKINNYRRAHCHKRNVDKIFTDNRSGNAHPFANGSANAKYMPFYKMFETVHAVNIKN